MSVDEVNLTDLLAGIRDDADARRTATFGVPVGLGMLRALQAKHVYAGTVPADVVAKRRARNKVARRSRAINRARSR